MNYSGWRLSWSSMCFGTGDKFNKCIEKNTFNKTDILAISENKSINAKSFYINKVRGVVQSLEIDVGAITQYYLTTMEISLNTHNNLSYTVAMMDPRIQIFSRSPDTLPRSWFRIAEGQSGIVQFYLRVKRLWYKCSEFMHCICRPQDMRN